MKTTTKLLTALLCLSILRLQSALAADPVLVGQWPGHSRDSAYAAAVAVTNNIAYLADGQAGLEILDVSDPAKPVRLGGYKSTGEVIAVQVVGNRAYLCNGVEGLRILDVSKPTNPVLLTPTDHVLGGWDGDAFDVQVVGSLAYLVGSSYLAILDVSNPVKLRVVGLYQNGSFARAVQVVENLTFIASLDGAGVQILDVRDPTRPVLVGRFDAYRPNSIQVVENLVYTAEEESGMGIIDVSNPAKPVLVSRTSFGLSVAVDIQVVGNLAYVSSVPGAGLRVFDVSSPSNPLLMASYGVGDGRSGRYPGAQVQVVGDRAYFAAGYFGLHILDVGTHPPFKFGPVARPSDGVLGLSLTGEPGKSYVLQASTNLVDWLTIRTSTATGFTLDFQDTDAANFPRRFYRARLVNQP